MVVGGFAAVGVQLGRLGRCRQLPWVGDVLRSPGALLTQPQLDALLADLESLRINGEWGSNVTETTGLDDVQLLP